MNESEDTIEKLEYLTEAGWKIPGDVEDESNLELLQLALPIIVSSKMWYSIDEAYRIQMAIEKSSLQ